MGRDPYQECNGRDSGRSQEIAAREARTRERGRREMGLRRVLVWRLRAASIVASQESTPRKMEVPGWKWPIRYGIQCDQTGLLATLKSERKHQERARERKQRRAAKDPSRVYRRYSIFKVGNFESEVNSLPRGLQGWRPPCALPTVRVRIFAHHIFCRALLRSVRQAALCIRTHDRLIKKRTQDAIPYDGYPSVPHRIANTDV
jgi:hypothetical protein